MHTHIKTGFLLYTFVLFLCLNFFFLGNTEAQNNTEPVVASANDNYTFETIDVPNVEFLAVTASSDFEDYAGYTKSADGEKDVAFTLIDGIFTTYDFPGSQNTYFYALGNNGQAAGHYQDSDGLYQGVVLENGELQPYGFQDAVQTEIYGISDATGALTGDFIDASGVRRGFSGDTIVEVPGALATYAAFATASGAVLGSYIDGDGLYHSYVHAPDGRFIFGDVLTASNLEYAFTHGVSDVGVIVARVKMVDDVPRTYVGRLGQLHELQVPGSVSTEGWNINRDGSVVGHYDSPDGHRYGFIARPTEGTAAQVDTQPVTPSANSDYTFETIDVPGVDFLELTASSDFEDYAGNTLSADGEKIVAFTLIDGVFTTYDFPGSQNTYFYALGNNGDAAGHYEDSDGLYQGVVLENGELQPYGFPGAVQTEIYGISDATGALTGNFIDVSGIRRGFSGDTIVEVPGALATYADFVSGSGTVVGSYIDSDGLYHAYGRAPDGRFIFGDVLPASNLEYIFTHGVNDVGVIVTRVKPVDDVPRTYVGRFGQPQELQVPGSVSTEGYNINQDGSVVGHYTSADGSVHGFIARPVTADTPSPVDEVLSVVPVSDAYTFESIEVPGVDFLEVSASNDFGDYAGNTRSLDGEKTIGFTLIDGVFTTYDFPGSLNTYFYALDNAGKAAGHYKDIDGVYHGVILEGGELQQYDFPGAAETHIYGLSDETGALSGNIVDAAGVSHAFSGELTITVPGAVNTYGDFVNAAGAVVGSYVDADGRFHGFIRHPDGSFTTIDLPEMPNLEFLFVNTITDAGVVGFRAKAANDILRSYLRLPDGTLQELRFPGSVRTVVRNVNQDGSLVGYYDLTDGQRYGFVGRPTTQLSEKDLGNTFSTRLSKGLNMLSVPLKPTIEMTARSLAVKTGATAVVTLDAANQQFVGWTPNAPDDGFPIEGAKGYIVNIPQTRDIVFTGTKWTNQMESPAAPAVTRYQTWAFVVSGYLGGTQHFNGYLVTIRNKRTNTVMTTRVHSHNYFAAATADLNYRGVVELGDRLELTVTDTHGNIVSERFNFTVNPMNLANAVLNVTLEGIGMPKQSLLLQNYPNPFNPETWIPYQLSEDSLVSVSIYDTTGKLVRTLSLGFQSTGFYNSRERAAYWDGRNDLGERVASGVYFYQLTTPAFQQTRRMLILK
ncbi:MAG: T9SS type A sorting domain-containing protein [Candidatus Poribacteria bacterium]|nr:T9SS type A sorting domain-containing protein [Candidatus Poribacteria bacterium]